MCNAGRCTSDVIREAIAAEHSVVGNAPIGGRGLGPVLRKNRRSTRKGAGWARSLPGMPRRQILANPAVLRVDPWFRSKARGPDCSSAPPSAASRTDGALLPAVHRRRRPHTQDSGQVSITVPTYYAVTSAQGARGKRTFVRHRHFAVWRPRYSLKGAPAHCRRAHQSRPCAPPKSPLPYPRRYCGERMHPVLAVTFPHRSAKIRGQLVPLHPPAIRSRGDSHHGRSTPPPLT